jgi:hypothetical protein
MVHQQHGRPLGRRSERPIEPGEPLLAQCTADFPGHQGVERDDAQWPVLYDELQKAVRRQIAVAGEGGAQGLARVVIAGDHQHRHVQGREQHPEMVVFLGLSVIDEVAGDDHEVGQWIESIQRPDGAVEKAIGVDDLADLQPWPRDVGIADLGDEHGDPLPAASNLERGRPGRSAGRRPAVRI